MTISFSFGASDGVFALSTDGGAPTETCDIASHDCLSRWPIRQTLRQRDSLFMRAAECTIVLFTDLGDDGVHRPSIELIVR